MDNLSNKTIKQFNFNTDFGVVCITVLQDKETKFVEFWGHNIGYGNVHFLIGHQYFKGMNLKKYAYKYLSEFYDDFAEEIEDDITEYMGGHDCANMHGKLKELYKEYSENLARVNK